jgi:hypothetical protein
VTSEKSSLVPRGRPANHCMQLSRIVFEAFFVVWTNRIVFGKALALPFVLITVVDLLKLLDIPPPLDWIFVMLALLVNAAFAIVTHRLVLLGPSSVWVWGLRRITRRELLFGGYLIAVSILALLPGAAMSVLVVKLTGLPLIPFFVVTLLIYAYLVTRFSLVFPGTAVDKWITLDRSWRLSQRYQFHLFFVVIVFPSLLAVPSYIALLFPSVLDVRIPANVNT